jgi:hypothetical protein
MHMTTFSITSGGPISQKLNLAVKVLLSLCLTVSIFSCSDKPAENMLTKKDETAKKEPEAATPPVPEGPQPEIVVEEKVFQFGIMELGSSRNHTFVIKNVGKGPLHIIDVAKTCKCTDGVPELRDIPPGESTNLPVTWKPTYTSKEFEQTVTIFSNDTKNPRVEIQIKGIVDDILKYEPNLAFVLGELSAEKPTPFTGKIYTNVVDKITIPTITPSTDDITCRYEPMTEAELKEVDAKAGVKLIGETKPYKGLGLFQASIFMLIELPDRPTKEITYNIKGFRNGPLKIVGTDWFANESIIDLKRFDSKVGVKKQLTLILKTDNHQPIEVQEIIADPAFITFKMEPYASSTPASNSSPTDEAKKSLPLMYKMMIEIPPNTAPMVRNSENFGHLTVKTNHPDIPKIQFNIQMFSY